MYQILNRKLEIWKLKGAVKQLNTFERNAGVAFSNKLLTRAFVHLSISIESSWLVVLYISSKKIHRSTFQYIEDISIVFLRRIWRQSVRKKFRQRYDLFMQNKFLYRLSSFYEKRIDPAED